MSLREKASKVNFAALSHVGPAFAAEEGASRPKTAPGAMMAFANDQRSVLLVAPAAMRPWNGTASFHRADFTSSSSIRS